MQRQFLIILGIATFVVAASAVFIIYTTCACLPRNYRPIADTMNPTLNSPITKGQPVIENPFENTWKAITIKATTLPKNSYYKIDTSKVDEYKTSIYFPYSDEPLLYAYDVGVEIIIKSEVTRETLPLRCVTPAPYSITSSKMERNKFDLGFGYSAEVELYLNYHSPGIPGGNPNPFTSELLELLDSVWTGLRIGNCT